MSNSTTKKANWTLYEHIENKQVLRNVKKTIIDKKQKKKEI